MIPLLAVVVYLLYRISSYDTDMDHMLTNLYVVSVRKGCCVAESTPIPLGHSPPAQ